MSRKLLCCAGGSEVLSPLQVPLQKNRRTIQTENIAVKEAAVQTPSSFSMASMASTPVSSNQSTATPMASLSPVSALSSPAVNHTPQSKSTTSSAFSLAVANSITAPQHSIASRYTFSFDKKRKLSVSKQLSSSGNHTPTHIRKSALTPKTVNVLEQAADDACHSITQSMKMFYAADEEKSKLMKVPKPTPQTSRYPADPPALRLPPSLASLSEDKTNPYMTRPRYIHYYPSFSSVLNSQEVPIGILEMVCAKCNKQIDSANVVIKAIHTFCSIQCGDTFVDKAD